MISAMCSQTPNRCQTSKDKHVSRWWLIDNFKTDETKSACPSHQVHMRVHTGIWQVTSHVLTFAHLQAFKCTYTNNPNIFFKRKG